MDNVIPLRPEQQGMAQEEEKKVETTYRIMEFVPIDYKKEMALYCSIGLNLGFALGYLLVM
ncbi:MAG: hypothetical protein ACO3MF_04570 [Acholeplasmataceae bacterium]